MRYKNHQHDDDVTMKVNAKQTPQTNPQGQNNKNNHHHQPPNNPPDKAKGFKAPQNDKSKNQNEAKKNSQHHQDKKVNQSN